MYPRLETLDFDLGVQLTKSLMWNKLT